MTISRKKKPVGFDEWLTKKKKRRTKCETCRFYPEVVDATRQYLQAVIDNETSHSWQDLYDKMADDFGYSLTPSALSNHMRRCEIELYKQWKSKAKAQD